MKRQDALQELNMEKVKERMQERAPYNKQVKNGFVWEEVKEQDKKFAGYLNHARHKTLAQAKGQNALKPDKKNFSEGREGSWLLAPIPSGFINVMMKIIINIMRK